MIFEEYDSEGQDSQANKQLLKKALFEICKNNFDRTSALDQLIEEHGSLVVDEFGNNPFEVMHELADFYDFDDYENPDDGECRSFSDWSEYFCQLQQEKLSRIIFDLMTEGTSMEDMYASIQTEHKELAKDLEINNINEFKDYLEYHDFEDDILGIEQSLLEWKQYFDNDEFGLYCICVDLTEKNFELSKRLEDIKNIIEQNTNK